MKVLFIDEDVDVHRLVEALGNRYEGSSFTLAKSLADATEQISTKTFDVIVVDMWLPPDDEALPKSSDDAGMTAGIKLLDYIENSAESINKNVPTVIFSGLGVNHHDEVRRLWERRKDDVFRKPVRPDLLYRELLRRANENH